MGPITCNISSLLCPAKTKAEEVHIRALSNNVVPTLRLLLEQHAPLHLPKLVIYDHLFTEEELEAVKDFRRGGLAIELVGRYQTDYRFYEPPPFSSLGRRPQLGYYSVEL